MVEEWNSGLPRTNPDSGRVEDLNQEPPDFKSSALNHSATPPPHNPKCIQTKLLRSLMLISPDFAAFGHHRQVTTSREVR